MVVVGGGGGGGGGGVVVILAQRGIALWKMYVLFNSSVHF